MQLELAPLQRLAQTAFHQQAFEGLRVHLGIKELVGVLAGFFGAVHGGIGIFQQRGGVYAVVGVHADTDTAADKDFVLLYPHGAGQRGQHFFGHAAQCFVAVKIADQQRELIAAQPRYQAKTLCRLGEPRGNFVQHFIASLVAKRVINQLEAVQVDKHQRQRRHGLG